ncbi:unnamed protein product, partial [marine sediment metagenome]
PSIPAEKKDYTTGDHYSYVGYGQSYWATQTFTPLETYTTDKLVAYWSRAEPPGTITVALRLTDGAGKPTGGDLATGQTDGNTLPQMQTFDWRAVSIEPYELQQGVMYAYLARAPGAANIGSFYWRTTESQSAYPRGRSWISTNSGGSWGENWRDNNFEVWSAAKPGLSFKAGILHVRHPALLTVVHKRGELIVSGYDTLSSLDEECLTGQV